MRVAPKWAQTLLLEAMVWWEREGGACPNLELIWRCRARPSSCTGAWPCPCKAGILPFSCKERKTS